MIATERLTLRPMAANDFDELRLLWGDASFTRAIFPTALTGEEVWTRLLRDIGHWSACGYGNWAVRLTDGGDYVGSVGVLNYRREIEPPLDAPELGWGVAPRFQGQGMAFEAVTAALAWVDDMLKAPRTVCIIAPDNAPSLKLAARVGYRPLHEAVYRAEPIRVLERTAP